MNLQPKNGKKYHIFGKKRNKKFIFTHFRVTLPYFPKKVLFLTFFGVAPDFGRQPDFKIKFEFSRKKRCKKVFYYNILTQKWLKNGKTGEEAVLATYVTPLQPGKISPIGSHSDSLTRIRQFLLFDPPGIRTHAP